VCGRMNHCIIGGVGDGDSGEDGGDEQREARAAAARGTSPPPASWGSAATWPLPSWLYGTLPHGDGIHGGGKNVALVATNLWVHVSPTS
jgi:hypothetical protein